MSHVLNRRPVEWRYYSNRRHGTRSRVVHENRANASAEHSNGWGKKPNTLFVLTDNVANGVLSSYNGGILDTPTRASTSSPRACG
jgi:hypothetical protein